MVLWKTELLAPTVNVLILICKRKLFTIKQYFISYGITNLFFLYYVWLDSMKTMTIIRIFKTLSDKRSLLLDYTGWHIAWKFSFDHLTFSFHIQQLNYFMKSGYYFASPDYIVLRSLAEKTALYISVFWIATQTPTLFWERTNIYLIYLSIQKKLVFHQKLVIKKKKYCWEKWSIPNEFKPLWLHSRLFGTKPNRFWQDYFFLWATTSSNLYWITIFFWRTYLNTTNFRKQGKLKLLAFSCE